jgi:ribose 5-phosphate isomerase B
MRIAIGSDHRGYAVKSRIIQQLQQLGHEVLDEGASGQKSVDYPEIASKVASKVSQHDVDRGILVCGTGIGMSIAANKFPGVRAASVRDEFEAELSRRHNDLNVLCLSGDMLGERNLEPLVDKWLNTDFEGGRHARRLQKIADLERS